MRKTIASRIARVLDFSDASDEATDAAANAADLAPHLSAALTAFDQIVADIDGATVYAQALHVDGRVFIDLAECPTETPSDLVAA